jgi:hypothetical protein
MKKAFSEILDSPGRRKFACFGRETAEIRRYAEIDTQGRMWFLVQKQGFADGRFSARQLNYGKGHVMFAKRPFQREKKPQDGLILLDRQGVRFFYYPAYVVGNAVRCAV